MLAPQQGGVSSLAAGLQAPATERFQDFLKSYQRQSEARAEKAQPETPSQDAVPEKTSTAVPEKGRECPDVSVETTDVGDEAPPLEEGVQHSADTSGEVGREGVAGKCQKGVSADVSVEKETVEDALPESDPSPSVVTSGAVAEISGPLEVPKSQDFKSRIPDVLNDEQKEPGADADVVPLQSVADGPEISPSDSKGEGCALTAETISPEPLAGRFSDNMRASAPRTEEVSKPVPERVDAPVIVHSAVPELLNTTIEMSLGREGKVHVVLEEKREGERSIHFGAENPDVLKTLTEQSGSLLASLHQVTGAAPAGDVTLPVEMTFGSLDFSPRQDGERGDGRKAMSRRQTSDGEGRMMAGGPAVRTLSRGVVDLTA